VVAKCLTSRLIPTYGIFFEFFLKSIKRPIRNSHVKTTLHVHVCKLGGKSKNTNMWQQHREIDNAKGQVVNQETQAGSAGKKTL
jgi:hypothetical protein